MNKAVDILKKVINKNEDKLESLVSPQRPYGFRTYERGSELKQNDSIKLYSSEGIGYVSRSQVTSLQDDIDKYKVILSRADSGHPQEEVASGKQTNVICKGKVLKPGEICTETWLSIGSFDTEMEANNLNNYLNSKFVRFLLLQSLTSIMVTNTMFKSVPIQDFKESWTDEKLYKKYDLSDDEINFIESIIRPMN
jgi:site-specific DNA-methyltransferase (adenine-specific)